MSITLQNVAVVQGTGSIVSQPVLEVTLDITNSTGNPVNFTASISINGGSDWHTCDLLAGYAGQGLTAGSARVFLVDMAATLLANSALAGYNSNGATLRITGTDSVTPSNNSTVTSSSFSLKTTVPTFSAASIPTYAGASYTGVDAAHSIPITLTSNVGSTQFRVAASPAQLAFGSNVSFYSFYSGHAYFAFASNESDGPKTLYVQTYDANFNPSAMVSVSVWLQRTPPTDCVVQIVGSVGNSDYTGITINPDGSFTPNRQVTLQISAASPLPMTFSISAGPGTNVESGTNTGTPITYQDGTLIPIAANLIQQVGLTTNPVTPNADNFGCDATVSVSVQFTDAAGNTQLAAPATIRLNTTIYQAAHKPLKPQDASYHHILNEVTTGNATLNIPQTILLSSSPIRAWNDIFYPSTHRFPTLTSGEIDLTAAKSMLQAPSALHDPIKLANIALNGNGSLNTADAVVDDDGRYVMGAWTTDGSKNYPNMDSSVGDQLSYWVVNNANLGDFQLEFDYFDLDTAVFGPPYNPLAPYRGDCLVIYDATAAGALIQSVNNNGQLVWVLNDSTKLVQIAAYTGTGTNVVNLFNNQPMSSGQNGNFTSDWIRGIGKIVMIFYSDASHTASGFRLKAGRAHDRIFLNWDIDEANGRIWVHKHTSLNNSPMGAAGNTTKQMVYQYLDQDVVIDHETGVVAFTVPPSGVVTADYSYLDYTTPPSDMFVAAYSDFVYYQDATVYVTPGDHNNSMIRSALFDASGFGRVTSHATWDKERGVLQFAAGTTPTSGRLFADYYHHTYLRLSDDGHGDLTYNDKVLVADITPVYPDYSFADVKIVNEGDALLEQGTIKFTLRGYDTNNDGEIILTGANIVDMVLDINRPWDVQKGTRAETVDKMAMAINTNYQWARTCLKTDAQNILSNWQTAVFGSIAARSRVYGRAVWVLGGGGGNSYPATSAGPKRCSLELAGKYYANVFV